MDLNLSADEEAFRDELRAWLAANVSEVPTFASLDDEFEWGRAWQRKLASARWVGIHWPAEYGGRDATPLQVAIYNLEYARAGAVQPVNRNGINLVGPTLLAHGTEEQKAQWLPSILRADEIWCQLFSEPNAGSDLAGLSTTATETDDGWVLRGQKVWTSYAHYSRWAIALVRTDPDLPKHRGLSYLVVDMTSPGVDIRPLRTITGEPEFNEVFLDDVFVPREHLIGGLNNGWAVAQTTLAHERGTSFPFKEQVVHEIMLRQIYTLADRAGVLDDPAVARLLAAGFVELRTLRMHNLRTLSRLARGELPGPESSVVKLCWSNMTQLLSEIPLTILGEDAALFGDVPGNVDRGKWQRQWLWSKAATIAGGTSEIQRTIIGERILGLPR
jgi:alkylation response protein AidB-like acyl-CoA dehydrogenase